MKESGFSEAGDGAGQHPSKELHRGKEVKVSAQ